jgi:hypothetical protein
MAEGSSVSAHVIKFQGYIQSLEALGVPFPADIGTDMIVKSLPPRFVGFVMNYNMHGMNKSLAKFFVMLKFAKKDIQKNTNNVLLVRNGTLFKKKKSGPRRKVAPRVRFHATCLRKSSSDLRLTLSASSVRRRVTGRGIAPSTRSKEKDWSLKLRYI